MAFKTWDYAASRARANAADDMYRDAGLDPENINTHVLAPSGLPFDRSINRMLEGLIPRTGTKTLWNGDEQNDYLALHTGSGSVYDDPMNGGTREYYSAAQTRPIRTSALIARTPWDDLMEREQTARLAASTAEQKAHGDQLAQIRRAQTTIGRLSPELQGVFQKMAPDERAKVVAMTPERQYAALASSALRPPPMTAPHAFGNTIRSGDQTGLDDFLGLSSMMTGASNTPRMTPEALDQQRRELFQDHSQVNPVPVMRPQNASRAGAALPSTVPPQRTSSWPLPFFGTL